MGSRVIPPRIFRLTYRGANGRVAVVLFKAPYGGVFELGEVLNRALTSGQVRWYRLEPATTIEINRERDTLERWPIALEASKRITRSAFGV